MRNRKDNSVILSVSEESFFTFKKRITTLLLILSILLTPALSTAESSYDLDYFLYIKDMIQDNYFYEPTEEELMEGAIKGLFQALDKNSEYYTKEEFQSLFEDVTGDFVGIGVYITEEKGSIKITNPIKGSPAHRAGLKPGDKLISVDGQDIKGKSLDEVTTLIKGKAGTSVRIGISREGRKIYMNIRRAEIKTNPIEYQILEDGIGYIKISQFNQNTYENLLPVLKRLDKEKISSIIVDLRGNPGGILGEVVETLNLFIPEGPIVHIKYGKDAEQTYYSTLKKPKYKLAVLVNGNSASASEIFAGAVQDTKVGTIIGVPTYGKGTVQQIIPLPLGDVMKLTIAEYLTPNRRNINGKGIQPDIIVKNKNRTKDIQLERAVEVLRNL
ncbi:S41 family peptidase [Clostridium sp. Cult2]|uniref:S41 family peptidase n=1 Tax=Clostridium sp. Cult2 TaxID=2079003 RepID=UPI001F1A7F62|nr:S41 family peptidase [Clostridium sp. Cult2]MCF6464773.1 carboxyl-terminal protease [Clostridium sp. Cult2]